jgi:uncharacterized protein YcgI (DUF1989 family)
MTIKIETDRKPSRYFQAGAPTDCFLPDCRKPFATTCIHGQDGHYYCSEECAAAARKMGLTAVQELRRKRA